MGGADHIPDLQPESDDEGYEPTSPASAPMSVDEVKSLEPVLNMLGADEELRESLLTINAEIMKLVGELGGSQKGYRRERAKQTRHLVSEVYSAPRVTAALKLLPGLNLVPGFALDLTTKDENGEEWDFTKADRRAKARSKVEEEKPYCLIGSPSCTEYCSWQALNAARHQWSDEEKERRQAAADVHLAFVCELYMIQIKNGKYFLHEHPGSATSWKLLCVQDLLAHEKVDRVLGDQCQYGQADSLANPVRKTTGWMSNAPCVLQALSKRCKGLQSYCSRAGGGRHVTASGRLAREVAVYPFVLCKAILLGLQRQLRKDGLLQDRLYGLQPRFDEDTTATYRDMSTGEILNLEEHAHMEQIFMTNQGREEKFVDSVSGQPLQSGLVRAARALELEYFNDKKVWEKRPREEAFRRTGKKPITIKWIDTNKGDDESPNYRSRLVAREIRKAGEDPIFAPTPPLESLRTVLSLAATDMKGAKKRVRDPLSLERTQVSFIDICRAYFCASTDPNDPSYVELPLEDEDYGVKCGVLLKHMYGTRKAADGWHCEYAGQLVNTLGFEVGDASACVFFHKNRDLKVSVHGDDLTAVGEKKHLDWYKLELEKLYELKETARLGPGPTDDKEATVLNRVVRWTADGLEYEADPRQQEKLLRDLKLDGEGVKAAASPGVKPTREQTDADEPLGPEKTTPYRAVSARSNYLSSDRPELQFAAKECCRWMSAPTELGLSGLKRLGRYVSAHKRLVFLYPWQEANRTDTYSDTDWAGCVKTRKSTSGGCLLLGRHLIKSWSSTQSSVSLSSGESEFYGVVKASGIALGYQSLLRDLGHDLPVRVWTDSTATLGICGRQGLGKLRHIDTHYLWVQQRVRDKTFELYKVKGEDNPADLFTKHLVNRERVHNLLELFGCVYRDGRATKAPKMRTDVGTSKGEMLTMREQAAGDTMVWGGRTFQADRSMGEIVLPEAFHTIEGVLPHMHSDLEERFPMATAGEDAGDVDPTEDERLERRGEALGKSKARFKVKC